MKGREVSSLQEKKAAEIILKEFKKIKKFKPLLQHFIYLHPDSLKEKKSSNVYCFINNHADSTILIGAHYEHIGLGGKLSYSLGKKNQIHNGADDNASGVALMLGLSQTFRTWQSRNYNYLFVAYSAHEIGLFGSSSFYGFSKGKFPPICQVINFDMVGRLDEKQPVVNVYGIGKGDKATKNQLDSLAFTFKTKIYTEEESKITDTDCRAFVREGIRCLSFTTGLHSDYHKVSDDEEKINYSGIFKVQMLVETLVCKTVQAKKP
ncbi:MAG: M28 family peptidase [Bacteroidota bacterium]|nr:M28 family peptidase [Bacteroidota bacterium]